MPLHVIAPLALFQATAPRLHGFDLALIAVYLVAITLFGLRFRNAGKKGTDGKPDKSLKNYFLANRTVPWWAIALSIVSAETSTLTIISIPGVAFAGDFGFLQVVLGYMLGRIVVALIFLPKYFKGEMLTAYQLIDRRFGATLHKTTAGLFLLTRAAAEGVRVFAVSIVVGVAIGAGDTASIAIISFLTLLYTFEGGMAAVIWTDVVQMAIYVGGTVVAIFTLGAHVPGGWGHIHEVAGAAGKFHLFNFAFNLTQSYTFWAGVLGGTFLTMASHGTDQLMVQRMLAAKNLGESRLALLSSGVVIFFQFTLFLLIGAGLYVFYGAHPATFRTNDYIFPTFIVREMPEGIAGLLVAAILAAAMSNLSAALNSLSSTTVVDFYMHWRPQADDRERMLISRSSTVVWALVLFAIAVYSVHAGGKGHVVETGLSIASVAYGCLLGVFLLGTLTRYATQWGSIVGMVCGFALNVYLWQGSFPVSVGGVTIPKIAFTWFVLIGAVVTFVVGSLASLVFRKQSAVRVVAALIVCLAFSRYGVSQGTQVAAPNFSSVDKVINDAIAAKKLPGAVVIVGHDGKIAYEKAYGLRKLAGEPGLDGKPSAAEPMTEDTIFDMASLTKCLATATAVMQLYEMGKLQFDDPVVKYLPEFGANDKEKVTIRELLTHYSGLPPDISLKDPWGLAAPDKAEGIRRAMDSKLVSAPGTHFEYSDINFITLGALVEKISGQPLDEYAAEHIFKPLGMTETRYLPIGKACGEREIHGAAIALPPPPPVVAGEPRGVMGSCNQDQWTVHQWVSRVASTAHDDELNAAVNPDFDRLLRGTVHDPTTRRMGGVAGHAGVFSTAHDAALFAQALLDKLLHNTGPFPLKQSTLQLMTKPEQPATAESGATIFTPDGQPTKGVATRGFGWDINSAYSRPRGAVFPIGSFGHTGFTGTSIWMDPSSDSYVVLLANAIHPRGNPPISPLRGEVATAAAKALGLGGAAGQKAQTGVDVLESTHYATLAGLASNHKNSLKLGLLTNQTGLDSGGRRTIDVLFGDAAKQVPGLALVALFSPEHGILGVKDDEHVGDEVDPATHLRVVSLYGLKDSDKRPSHEALKGLDAVVIDLQDAGVRFYTYDTVVGYFLEAAAAERDQFHHTLEIVVLDRPNLIGGEAVQGPVSDANLASYTDYMPLPVRHGMTIGELARYINGERRLPSPVSANIQAPLGVPLTVVTMQDWSRRQYYDETGLPWISPSPNLRSVPAAVVYPGVGLTETTNISVGRGTDKPFEQIGACWAPSKSPVKPAGKGGPPGPCAAEDQLDGGKLAAYLTARKIPGVVFAPTSFAVAEDSNRYPGHGQTLQGISIRATDRDALDSPEMGIELLSALQHLYPARFTLAKAETLVASVNTMRALANGDDPRTIAAAWAGDLNDFKKRRRQYLLYPDADATKDVPTSQPIR